MHTQNLFAMFIYLFFDNLVLPMGKSIDLSSKTIGLIIDHSCVIKSESQCKIVDEVEMMKCEDHTVRCSINMQTQTAEAGAQEMQLHTCLQYDSLLQAESF